MKSLLSFLFRHVLFPLLILVALSAFIFVRPAFALGMAADAGPTITLENVVSALILVVVAFVVYFLVAYVLNQGTEIGKGLSRAFAGWTGFNVGIRGVGSYFLAILIAAVVVFKPDSNLGDLLQQVFTQLNVSLDPNIVKALVTLALAIMASKQADTGQLPGFVAPKFTPPTPRAKQ